MHMFRLTSSTRWAGKSALLKVSTLLVAGVLVGGVAACGSADGSGDATLEQIKKAGVVKIGYANEAPYSYKDGDNLTGFDMELLKAFFKENGVEVDGQLVDFAGLIPGLQADRYDMVGAGMFILPDRCKLVDFGQPEYAMQDAFAVAKGNPLNIHSWGDLAASDGTLGTSSGGGEVEYATVAGIPSDRIKTFPSYADAAAALAAGHVDVVAQLQLGLRDTLKALNSDKVEYIELTEPGRDKLGDPAIGYGAAVFPKGADDLREAYDEWLAKAREDGTYQKIAGEFGFTEANYPPADLTADDLCGRK